MSIPGASHIWGKAKKKLWYDKSVMCKDIMLSCCFFIILFYNVWYCTFNSTPLSFYFCSLFLHKILYCTFLYGILFTQVWNMTRLRLFLSPSTMHFLCFYYYTFLFHPRFHLKRFFMRLTKKKRLFILNILLSL